jgi:hypothetical protein
MKNYIVNILIIIAVAVLAITGAYIERGYWAVGMEYAVPVIVAALLPFKKGEKYE